MLIALFCLFNVCFFLLQRWLDPSKSIKKQLGNCQYPLYFRVKFYVSDPSKLQEEYTRYQFYLQVRRDILEGRLILAPSTACLLASYTVQCKLHLFKSLNTFLTFCCVKLNLVIINLMNMDQTTLVILCWFLDKQRNWNEKLQNYINYISRLLFLLFSLVYKFFLLQRATTSRCRI